MIRESDIKELVTNYLKEYGDNKTFNEIIEELTFDEERKTQILLQLELLEQISNSSDFMLIDGKVVRLSVDDKYKCNMCKDNIKNKNIYGKDDRYMSIFCKGLNEYVCKDALTEDISRMDNHSFCPKLKKEVK